MPASSLARPAAATARWLAVVGIGEDGAAGLGAAARAAVEEAEFVFGGERHIELAQALIRGEAQAWPKPFDPGMAAVLALRGRRVCVLASGDPFLHGVGATLARVVPAHEMDAHPAPSAFSLAAARLGWALHDTDCISLHGRPIERLRPLLHPGRRVLALTSDAQAPPAIVEYLCKLGFGPSRITVLEALGGAEERLTRFAAQAMPAGPWHPLNVMAIEVKGGSTVLPRSPGLPESLFRHDGQITKRDIRALTIAALAPRRDELLWDIGAGSGSVAIEWLLADPSLRAAAVEARSDRAANIRANALALGVPFLQVVEGRAPAALEGLPAPDAVFLGGGGSGDGVAAAAMAALKPGGRLVANAVTLEMEAVLLDCFGRHGGELSRIAVSRAEAVGSMAGWRPAMPVTQWRWEKP